ncbi:hypothetical protein PGB90_004661 [Kerria lacca]
MCAEHNELGIIQGDNINVNDEILFPAIAKDLLSLQKEIKCSIKAYNKTYLLSLFYNPISPIEVTIIILVKYLALKNSLIFFDGCFKFETSDPTKAWYSAYLALYLASYGTGGKSFNALFRILRAYFTDYENIDSPIIFNSEQLSDFNEELQNSVNEIVSWDEEETQISDNATVSNSIKTDNIDEELQNAFDEIISSNEEETQNKPISSNAEKEDDVHEAIDKTDNMNEEKTEIKNEPIILSTEKEDNNIHKELQNSFDETGNLNEEKTEIKNEPITSSIEEEAVVSAELQNLSIGIETVNKDKVDIKDIRRVKVNLLWFLKNIEIRKIRYYLGPDVEQYIRVNDWKTATFTIDIFDNAAGVNSFRRKYIYKEVQECREIKKINSGVAEGPQTPRRDVGIGVLTIFERRCAARKNNEFTKVDLLAKDSLFYPTITTYLPPLKKEINCAAKEFHNSQKGARFMSRKVAGSSELIIFMLTKYLALKNSLIFYDGYFNFTEIGDSKAEKNLYLALYLASYGTGGQPFSAYFGEDEIMEIRRHLINYERFVYENVIKDYDPIENTIKAVKLDNPIISDPQEIEEFNKKLQNSVDEIVTWNKEEIIENDSILETKKSDDYGEELQILFNETVDLRKKFPRNFKTGLVSFLQDIELHKIKFNWNRITFKLDIFRTTDDKQSFIFLKESYESQAIVHLFDFTLKSLSCPVMFTFSLLRLNMNHSNGPSFLPIIGSWYAVPPKGAEAKVAAWRKKYGNIIGNKIVSQYMVIVTGLEEVTNGLKHPNFQNRIHSGTVGARSFSKSQGLLFGDGNQWWEIKRFVLHYLSQACYKNLDDVMREKMLHWFSTIQTNKIVEVNSKFTECAINVVFALLAGNTKNYYAHEVDTIREITHKAFISGRLTGIDVFCPKTEILFSKATMAHKLLQERKLTFDSTNVKDCMDAYLLKQMEEKQSKTVEMFTDQQLLACFLDLVQAASESNANSISFILLYVALNPHVQKKIHEELDRIIGKNRIPKLEDKQNLPYCEAVIYETLRINPTSGLGNGHIVSEDTKFYRYLIPKDTVLFFAHNDLCADASIYSNPNSFVPERFFSKESKTKLTNFGIGKRACPGEQFAKGFLFLFVAYFFQKYTITLPNEYKNPSLAPVYGFINGPKPFKLLINERQ